MQFGGVDDWKSSPPLNDLDSAVQVARVLCLLSKVAPPLVNDCSETPHLSAGRPCLFSREDMRVSVSQYRSESGEILK